MFKKLLVLCFLALLLGSVFSIRLADPISKELTDNDYVGSFVAGSTIEFVFSKELGKFDTLKLESALPSSFKPRIKNELESVKLFIEISPKAVPGSYPLIVSMSGPNTDETVEVYFLIDNSLIDASLNNYFADAFVNEPAKFYFSLVNNSYADVSFVIAPDPSLGWYWFSENGSFAGSSSKTILVPKRKTLEEAFTVYPRVDGEKRFFFDVSAIGLAPKQFSARLNGKPTLVSKSVSPMFGLPFYSFSLLPNYFLNALIASFFN